jgi:hypothetical protein
MRKTSLEDEVTIFEIAESTHPLPENIHGSGAEVADR